MATEILLPGGGRALVGRGLLETCGALVREACGGARVCALVTDSHVAPLYAERVRASLEAAGARVCLLQVPAGEPSKCMARVEELCEAMARAGLDRKSFLAALGGGVIGDLAGFAAAVFLRGIPYAQMPTTLLAQVDSSVGGKTGVNLPSGKNLVGAFHQPRVVIADVAAWDTLPARVKAEGLAEAIKHGVIRDPELALHAPRLAEEDPAGFVARNIQIKAAVVAEDECETRGVREHLNFGHTLGHALEHAAGYGQLLHGEAVAIGMAAALKISQRKAGLEAGSAQAVIETLQAAGLPVRVPAGISEARVMDALARDKKFREGRIRFVVVPRLGEARVDESVTREELSAVLRELGAH